MDQLMRAQLQSLPPHLKMQILAATEAAKKQDSNATAASSSSAATAFSTDLDATAHIPDDIPPIPFNYTEDDLTDAAVTASSRSQQRFLTPAMLSCLSEFGFFIYDGVNQRSILNPASSSTSSSTDEFTASASNTLLADALNEARSMYSDQLMTHAGMKAVNSSSSTSTAAATSTSSVTDPASTSSSLASTNATSSTATSTPAAPSASSAAAANSNSNWKSSALRGDHHKWLHAGDAAEQVKYPALHSLIGKIDTIRSELNDVLGEKSSRAADSSASDSSSSCVASTSSSILASAASTSSSSAAPLRWLPSPSITVQIASYQGGGSRYVAHRDSVPGVPPHRRVTSIIYLSEWKQKEQGGCLRMYTLDRKKVDAAAAAASASVSSASSSSAELIAKKFIVPYFTHNNSRQVQPIPTSTIFLSDERVGGSEERPTHIDVAPLQDRLVVFASACILHEVRPAYDLERYAMTVWMQ